MPKAASPLEILLRSSSYKVLFYVRSRFLWAKINNLASLFQFIINFYAMTGIGTLFTNKCARPVHTSTEATVTFFMTF